MTADQLRRLKERLDRQDTQEGVHIGLLNTHKRLELIYGERYKIRIFSRENRRTIIELKIKVQKHGNKNGTLPELKKRALSHFAP